MFRRKFLKFLGCSAVFSLFGLSIEAKENLQKGDLVRFKNGQHQNKTVRVLNRNSKITLHGHNTIEGDFLIVGIDDGTSNPDLFCGHTKDFAKI